MAKRRTNEEASEKEEKTNAEINGTVSFFYYLFQAIVCVCVR